MSSLILSPQLPREVRAHAPSAIQVMRRAVKRVRARIGRAVRQWALELMQLATDTLPAPASRALATSMGAVRFAISVQGPRNARIIQAFKNVDEAHARRLARRYLATTFLDLRFARRVTTGADDPQTWTCEQRNVEIVRPLIEANTPFIVATGHFAREARAYLYTKESIPHRLTTVVAPLIDHETAVLSENVMSGVVCVRPDLNFIQTGDSGMRSLIRTMRTPGNAVLITADSRLRAEERSSYERSFLGVKRRFATGAARLARMARCPIVVVTPQIKDDGSPVMIWRCVLPPATDTEGDIRVTDAIIDCIEQAVIENPAQYALQFWDHRTAPKI